MTTSSTKQSIRRFSFILLAFALLALGCSNSPSSPGGQETVIVYTALGASDAVGIGAFPLTDGYVFLLRDRMRGKADRVVLENLGISGARIETFLSDMLEPAVASNPDVITIWAGSNDVVGGRSPDDFGRTLDMLVSELTSRTSALIVIGDLGDLTLAPRFRVVPDPDVTVARVAAFNMKIDEVIARYNAVPARISSELPIDDSIFAIDGFHPSNKGHRLLADVFWNVLDPRL